MLTAGVAATAFALGLYLFFYNRESRVATAFTGLLTCVIVVYLVDLLLVNGVESEHASLFLRFQWLGIAFTPPFYLEFVRSIKLSVMEDRFPGWLRLASFFVSGLVALLAMFTDIVVSGHVISAGAAHLRPGKLFLSVRVCLCQYCAVGVARDAGGATTLLHARCASPDGLSFHWFLRARSWASSPICC